MNDYSERTIKVIITDDHKLILDSLTEMLNHEPDIQIVGKAANGEILLEMLQNKEADVILMDVNMPVLDGMEATRLVRERHPRVRVLMLTQHNDPGIVSQSIKNGAAGYVLKTADKNTLLNGIRTVNRGELYTGGVRLPNPYEMQQQIELTDREKEIICLIVQEKSAREIAAELHLSINTVNQHTKNIRSKLGVKNVVGVVNYAYEHHLCR